MESKKNRDWFGYLMNFAAVCLGIIITFAGQGIINRHAEWNEVKQYLRELSRLQMAHSSSAVKSFRVLERDVISLRSMIYTLNPIQIARN